MGEIYLTQNPHEVLEELNIPREDLRIFEAEEFKIDHAKDVINEAYISSVREKFIALIGKIFNKEAQNALLKVLEEPPHNIHFLLFVPYKNTLIPTIRSRMQIINKTCYIPIQPLELDTAHLTHQKIFEFLQSLNYLSRSQAQEVIERLFVSIQKEGIMLGERELEFFDTALRANHNHQKIHIILAPILISLLERKNENLSL